MSTNDAILLKGSMKDVTNPITYDKEPAKSQKICHKNFIATDIRGFGTKVGTYSNYSTIIEAMRPLFTRPEQAAQAEELLIRKKLLREINGQEIDRIKGVDAKGPPKDEWLKKWKIEKDDSEEVKKKKIYHNSLLLIKKPYFFRYLYAELNEKYKRYEKINDDMSRCMFRMKLKKLLAKSDKNDLEKSFVRRYHKMSPVLGTDCIMNLLCREIESVDFDIQYNKKQVNMLPHYNIDEYKIDPEILGKVRTIYKNYCNRKTLSVINKIFEECEREDYEDVRFSILDYIHDKAQNDYDELGLKPMDGLTYFYALSQSYAKFNWDVAWDVIGEDILDCIESDSTMIPVEDPNGEEFLGRKFKLVKVQKTNKEDFIDERPKSNLSDHAKANRDLEERSGSKVLSVFDEFSE